MIIGLSEARSNRQDVLDLLQGLKGRFPASKILDFGGGAGSWVGGLATHIVDLQPNPEAESAGISVIIGDGHLNETWEHFGDNYFDFVVCTHTLEDVRDPSAVAKHLSRVGKGGFIAVPNRHQEFSHLESPLWRGNLHHRWLFRGTESGLKATAKTSVITTSRLRRTSLALRSLPFGRRFSTAISNLAPAIRTPWWDRGMSRYSHFGPELSFFWTGNFDVEYLLNDMDANPGEMPLHHAMHVEEFLMSENLVTEPLNQDAMLQLLLGN